jgi:hypothetical protein
MASPARHRERAGKFQLPAVQGWGAGHYQRQKCSWLAARFATEPLEDEVIEWMENE